MGDHLTDYGRALEAAGAKVLLERRFGSYQGDWLAKVLYRGQQGWAHGGFGSCPGCDSYELHFDDSEETAEKLAEFGQKYLEDLLSQEQAEAKFADNARWSLEDEEALAWLKENHLCALVRN